MTKKVIQVPVDEELLRSLDTLCKRRRKARAELIRQACARYLKQAEEEEWDRIYQEGYLRIPEATDVAEAQDAMLAELLPEEMW